MNKKNINLANLYDKLFDQVDQDLEFYKYFIKKNGGLALEIGSGTGRLILNYIKDNLFVEGIEPDQDMINLCQEKAVKLKIKPTIYNQNLQNLSVNKKYKTIYLPLYVFQNIIEQNEIIQSLQNIYDHLEQNGQVLISIFIPWNDPTGTHEQTWRLLKTANDKNQKIILSESVNYDKFEQIQTKFLKYEVFINGLLQESLFKEIKYRCYSRFELQIMLEQAGFKSIEIFGDYSLQEANGDNEVFIFTAFKPESFSF